MAVDGKLDLNFFSFCDEVLTLLFSYKSKAGNNFTLDDVPEEVKALCNSTFCDFFTWSPANTTYSNISHTDMMV